jgi:hypothetical protein
VDLSANQQDMIDSQDDRITGSQDEPKHAAWDASRRPRLAIGLARLWLLGYLLAGCVWTARTLAESPAAGQPGTVVPRLAIIVEDPSAAVVADLLTAELSKKNTLQLLERAQIEKVYREQALAAANKDYLKLGQVLGAEGLLLLQPLKAGGSQDLEIRLIAVKPGVAIGEIRAPLPSEEAEQWAGWVARHFEPLFPKLAVQRNAAVPVSVVNLRSTLRSTGAQELERQLTLLTIERLAREQGLFVLERRRMELLSGEKELTGLTESEFWNGSYLLDGVLDRDGYAKDTVTISARLVPPKGGAPVAIEVSGSRTNLAETVDRLVEKVLASLKVGQTRTPWNAPEEAGKYFEEANWAYHWNMLPEAAAACEASWALGRRTKEVAELRILAYAQDGVDTTTGHYDLIRRLVTFVPGVRPARGQFVMPPLPCYGGGVVPDATRFARVRRALELYCEDFPTLVAPEANPGWAWHDLGLDLLENSTYWLQHYYFMPEGRAGQDETIEVVQGLARQTARLIAHHPAFTNCFDRPEFGTDKVNWGYPPAGRTTRRPGNLITIKATGGAFWTRTPEEGVGVYREVVESGFMPKLRQFFLQPDLAERMRKDSTAGGQIKMPERLCYLVGWKWEDRKRATRVWHGFIDELCASTNDLTRVEGLFLRCAQARTDAEHDSSFREIISWLEQREDLILAGRLDESLVGDLGNLVEPRGRDPLPQTACDARKELLSQFSSRLKQDLAATRDRLARQEKMIAWTTYLAQATYDFSAFTRLFSQDDYRPDEARVLLPALSVYRSNITAQVAALDGEKAELEPKWRQDPKAYGPRISDVRLRLGNLASSGFWLKRLEETLRRRLVEPAPAPIAATMLAAAPRPTPSPAHAASNVRLPGGPMPANPLASGAEAATSTPTNALEVTRFWSVPEHILASNVVAHPLVTACRYREGRLWVDTRFSRIGTFEGQETFVNRGRMFAVDLDSLSTETITVPNSFTLASPLAGASVDQAWEVYRGALYLSSADSLKRYSLKQKTWEDLPVPMPGHARLEIINQRLFASTDDSILEISAEGKEARVLASARRRPPVTVLDSLENYASPPLAPGPQGSLLTILGGKLFEQPAQGTNWTELASLPRMPLTRASVADSGLLLLEMTSTSSQRIFALFPGTRSLELQLVLPARPMPFMGPTGPSRAADSSQPKWAWPGTAPRLGYGLALEGRGLWLFGGRIAPPMLRGPQPDLRPPQIPQGLVLNFQPEQSTPLEIPVRLRLPEGVRAGLQIGNPREVGLLELTPQGLVVSSTACPGFWVIPQAQLSERRKEWLSRLKSEPGAKLAADAAVPGPENAGQH